MFYNDMHNTRPASFIIDEVFTDFQSFNEICM